MSVQVVLADDHEIVRQGLKALLEREGFRVVGEAANGREAVRLTTTLHPDATIVDISMPHMNGLDAAQEMTQAYPRSKTIALTQHKDDTYVIAALRAGFRGYVLKSQAATDLVAAIRGVLRGEVYLSPGVSRTVVEAYLSKSDYPTDPLTPRERQVLQMIGEGNSTKEIASFLGISGKTVETHRSKLMRKLDIHEIAGLVRYAIRRGFIQP